MKKILILLLSTTLYCCSTGDHPVSEQTISRLGREQDSLSAAYPLAVEPLIGSDWLEQYSAYIKKKFPKFTMDYSRQSFLVVPALTIPAGVLEKDNTNMLSYLDKGKLDLKFSTIYILEDGRPVGTFRLTGNSYSPFSPGTFHASFKESQIIEILKKSDLYFEIAIKYGSGAFFIPAVVFYSYGKFQFYNSDDDTTYPIDEIYRAYSPGKEKFDSFINKIVEANNAD